MTLNLRSIDGFHPNATGYDGRYVTRDRKTKR